MGVTTENGWPQCSRAQCETQLVPGTKKVKLELRAGDVGTILTAWAAWWHRNVRRIEPTRRAPQLVGMVRDQRRVEQQPPLRYGDRPVRRRITLAAKSYARRPARHGAARHRPVRRPPLLGRQLESCRRDAHPDVGQHTQQLAHPRLREPAQTATSTSTARRIPTSSRCRPATTTARSTDPKSPSPASSTATARAPRTGSDGGSRRSGLRSPRSGTTAKPRRPPPPCSSRKAGSPTCPA